ncbi:MAG: hypothetical protein ACLFWF_00510 [Alphaproteobacteria bacterium]
MTRLRIPAVALTAGVLWMAPLPAGIDAPGLWPGTAPAHALGGYQPDGPVKPGPNKKGKTPKPEEQADLGTPLDRLPPAAEIDLKGVSPAIAEMLRSGADAGSMADNWAGQSDAANIVGPIKAAAGAPWVVEPKLPPQDTIVVEGETSKFNQAVNMGEWLDYFFNDERLEDEINYTRLRFRGDAFFQDGEGVELEPDVDVKLSVPGLERRLVLFLNGDLNDGFDESDDDIDRLDPEEEENVLLGVQTFLNATRRFNVSIRGGVRFRDGSPVVFAGPRYRKIFNLDPWALRVTAEARWFTDEGLATRGFLDFDRKFSENLFLRLTPGASWSEEEENLKYRFRAFLFHRLSNKSVMRYSALAKFDTDTDDSLVDAMLRVAWRQKIIRDWLVVELAPEVTFPEDRDYEPVWGFRLRLETTFDVHMPWLNH